MPELPEVEVSRLGISPHLTGRTISQIIVRESRMRWPVPSDVQQAVGHKIIKVERRAKYLLIHVDAGALVLHLGMSGKLRVIPATTPTIKHDHIDVVLDSGQCLRFNDPRRFGAFLWQAPGETLALFNALGPEPLTDDFDGTRLVAQAKGKQVAIKNLIMSNAVVVGVGNIYANEALFMSGIDPRRAAGKVSRARLMTLADNIKVVLARAIEQGGTTLKDFAQVDGKPGYFKQALHVYGRVGESCDVCESEIKSVVIGQRNSFYCPTCQR